VPLPTAEEFSSVQVSTAKNSSITPVTLGSRRKPSDEVGQFSEVGEGSVLLILEYAVTFEPINRICQID
jgi:hypothetical protein